MRGINGIVSNNKIEKLNERIIKMNSSILEKDIKSNVYEIKKNKIAFGHSIDKFSPSSSIKDYQPIFSQLQDLVLIFYGEIYNYNEIINAVGEKETCLGKVIILYIKKHGINQFLKVIDGIFSMVIYSEKSSKIYLIRDHFGVVPLYYTINERSELIFSSDIGRILKSGLVQPEFFQDAVDEYLAYRYIRPPFTFCKNIFQVEPAHVLIFDSDLKINKTQYWKLPEEFNMDVTFSEEKIIEEFHEKLQETVTRRLNSNLPIGAYLSGGVDSSLLTAMTVNILNRPIHTYTIGFEQLNEFEYSELIATQYKTIHHSLMMNKYDFLKSMENIISIKAAPLGVPNEIPLFVMSNKMAENISIVLSGEGADELFGGYGRIYRSPFEFNKKNQSMTFYEYFINQYEYVPRSIRDEFTNNDYLLRKYFDEKVKKEFGKYNNEANVFRFFHQYHVQSLLQRLDVAIRANGIIARTPFIDYRLIEYVYKEVPYELKLKWKSEKSKKNALQKHPEDYSELLDIPKYILKKIGETYLPKEILYRKKMGFPVPLNKWFQDLEKLAIDILINAPWIKKGKVNELVAESKLINNSGQLLWMLINIEIFRKNFFMKNWLW